MIGREEGEEMLAGEGREMIAGKAGEEKGAGGRKMTDNGMKGIRIGKVVVNMGVGQAGDELKKAVTILERITNAKPIQTLCRIKQPIWGIRIGLPIGAKVTLRGEKAIEFLKNALSAKDNKISGKSFDKAGNFGFGIAEYIDLPGAKYDPKLGIRGFDVLVSVERKGYRVKHRKRKKARTGKRHAIAKDEAVEFVKNTFGVVVE